MGRWQFNFSDGRPFENKLLIIDPVSTSLEWRAIDPIQAHMAIFRAIENGVTLVRQADNDLSIVGDPYGRVLASMDHFNSSERVTVGQVPILSAFTLYPCIGDLFAWLAMAGLIGIYDGNRERQPFRRALALHPACCRDNGDAKN